MEIKVGLAQFVCQATPTLQVVVIVVYRIQEFKILTGAFTSWDIEDDS